MSALQVALELRLIRRRDAGILLSVHPAEVLRVVGVGIDLDGIGTGHVTLLSDCFGGSRELVFLFDAHTGHWSRRVAKTRQEIYKRKTHKLIEREKMRRKDEKRRQAEKRRSTKAGDSTARKATEFFFSGAVEKSQRGLNQITDNE